MARGRTLFTEYRRRAASVPAEEYSFPDTTTASKLYHIKSHVDNDTDALLSASRRHDRDFLRAVQNQLINTAHARSASVKGPRTLNHNKALGPPPSRSAYYAALGSALPQDQRRRTWYGPTSAKVDDYEVNAYLDAPVRRPYIRSIRAGSVPPVLPSRAGAPRWFPSAAARGSSVPRWAAPLHYRTYGGASHYLQNHPDMEDIVVGVAPTALYGDIMIGIPRNKQFMFNAQHGFDAVQDLPPRPLVHTRVTSPYFGHRNKLLLDSPYEEIETPRRRSYSFSVPSSYRPSSSYYHHHHGEGWNPQARISHYGYHHQQKPLYRPFPSHELDFDLKAPPRESLSSLRARAALASDRANQHKSLIYRYAPVDLGPRGHEEVVIRDASSRRFQRRDRK